MFACGGADGRSMTETSLLLDTIAVAVRFFGWFTFFAGVILFRYAGLMPAPAAPSRTVRVLGWETSAALTSIAGLSLTGHIPWPF